jgi:hypothetical protein
MTTAVLRSAQTGAILTSPSVGGARHVTMPLASATQVVLSRLTRILLLVAVALCLGAPAAGADGEKLDNILAALWTKVLTTPSAQNSFGTGGPTFACWDLGGTVAPFAPAGVESCRVEPGTQIFIASTVECSTFELPPGATDKELRECTRDNRPHPSPIGNPPLLKPDVTLDGKKVPVHLVETPLQNITLPAEPIPGPFPAGAQGSFVGRGWVALLASIHRFMCGVRGVDMWKVPFELG